MALDFLLEKISKLALKTELVLANFETKRARSVGIPRSSVIEPYRKFAKNAI